jgi:hypothetical protein
MFGKLTQERGRACRVNNEVKRTMTALLTLKIIPGAGSGHLRRRKANHDLDPGRDDRIMENAEQRCAMDRQGVHIRTQWPVGDV